MQIENTFNKPFINLPFSRWRFIDLIYPPFCCNCGKIGYEICPICYKNIDTIKYHKNCLFCGITIKQGKYCRNCKKTPPQFDQLRSWGIYTGVLKKVIQKIKYNRGFGIIEYIIGPIIKIIKKWNISVSMIIPVPLGKKRELERGYNQSVLIAEPISEFLEIPLYKHALIRTRETKSQVGLNFEERKINMQNAFVAEKNACEKKSVLLVDDIATTCSTLNESTKALKLAGAQYVFCFSVARTKNPIK